MKTIKFFQKWNKTAQRLEWSLTDVLSTLVLFYLFYFAYYALNLLKTISWNCIAINVIFLIAAFYPKYLVKIIDCKDVTKHEQK